VEITSSCGLPAEGFGLGKNNNNVERLIQELSVLLALDASEYDSVAIGAETEASEAGGPPGQARPHSRTACGFGLCPLHGKGRFSEVEAMLATPGREHVKLRTSFPSMHNGPARWPSQSLNVRNANVPSALAANALHFLVSNPIDQGGGRDAELCRCQGKWDQIATIDGWIQLVPAGKTCTLQHVLHYFGSAYAPISVYPPAAYSSFEQAAAHGISANPKQAARCRDRDEILGGCGVIHGERRVRRWKHRTPKGSYTQTACL
jgi:hypothetical protein